MRKLLASNWFIAKKSRLIALVCLVMLAVAGLSSVNNAHGWISRSKELEIGADGETLGGDSPAAGAPFEEIALRTVPGLGVVFAFLVSAFLNDEFSGGRIRDKIVGGFSRRDVYLSCFLTSFAACCLVVASVLLGDFAAAGLVDWSATEATVWSYLLDAGLLVLNTAAWCAIFTLTGMLVCGRGAASGVACLIVAVVIYVALLMIFAQIEDMLMEPEFVDDYVFDPETGVIAEGPSYPNPYYLNDRERAFWENAQQILPAGQATRLLGFAPPNPALMACSSFLIALACQVVGTLLFRRRDLN